MSSSVKSAPAILLTLPVLHGKASIELALITAQFA